MSGRTTVILFIILVVVAGVAYLMSQQEDQPAGDPTPTIPPTAVTVQFLEGVEINAIGRLEVESLGEEEGAVSYLREPDGGWFQIVPTQTAVISQTLNSNVTGLLNMTSRRTLAADENPLSAYGLDEPDYRLTVVVLTEEQQTVRHIFLVGDQTPAGDAYYVQKQGDPRVYIIPSFSLDNVFNLLTEPPIPTPTPEVTAPITGTATITATMPLSPTGTLTPTGTTTP